MNDVLLAELQREPWAMEPKALEALLLKISSSAAPLQTSAKDGWEDFPLVDAAGAAGVDRAINWRSPLAALKAASNPASSAGDPASRMSIENGVAVIPITGVLMKQVPWYFSWFGIDATAYGDVAGDIQAAIANPQVRSILLRVESPGGQVAGVEIASEAIYAARKMKPVRAAIQDIGASGAYWLAAQAETISATPNAMVGSIGVYSVYLDSSKAAEKAGYKVHVVSSGAHKGMGVPGAAITEEQLVAMKEVVDGMAANFKADVARGRGRGLDQVGEWATGRVWLAGEAQKLGLVDSVSTIGKMTGAHVGPAAESPTPQKGETMESNPKTPAAGEKDATANRESILAEERNRAKAIKAAFPKHPEFAMSQIEAGASLDEAKGAFSDVLAKENEKLTQDLAELKKKPAAVVPAGPEPIAAGGKTEAATLDFIEVARAHQKEAGGSLQAAMSHVARTQPKLHEAFMGKMEDKAPEVAARKRKLGLK